MIIKNAHVFIDGQFHDVDVRFDATGIREIGQNLVGDQVIDASGQYLYAGMVDAHCHGGFLRGFNYSTSFKNKGTHEEQIRYLLDRLPSTGVTTVFPTLAIIYPPIKELYEDLRDSVRNIRKVHQDYRGAEPLKFHFEHPFPTLDRYLHPGLKPATRELADFITDGDYSDVGIFGIAPDYENAMEFIDYLVEKGVDPEDGYTKATAELTREAADHGMNQASHLFNGYQPMHHRTSGPNVGVLLEDRIYAQLTLDGYHVNPAWVKLTLKTKGIDRCYGITDLSGYSGLPEGENVMDDGRVIHTHDGYNWREDGHLQSGNMVANEIMKCARDVVGLTMEEVGRLFFENPAKCLRIKDRGKIEVGRRSDLVIMDKDYKVIRTIIKGETYYEADQN
ncbi:MAG: amidohydrolase family protein [Erysipelotrichaceae bacterium]|nr:amidohydrolase family protein [Erysipelotrichaceae bacterium]